MEFRYCVQDAEMLVDLYSGKIQPIQTGHSRWYVHNHVLYILGTNDKKDWYDNLKALARPFAFRDGHVNRGYVDHAELVLRGLYMHGYNTSDIIRVSGHSLGGACAQYIGYKHFIPIISYGAPRLWRRMLWKFWDRQGEPEHWRIRHRADPVVGLPSKWRWKHRATVNHKLGPGWAASFWTMITSRSLTHWHWMGRYKKSLKAHSEAMAKKSLDV